VLLINALLGAHQEVRAERSSEALRRLLTTRATVSRDGEVVELDAVELVPGDVVWLESGNRVPADLRLLEARGLEVDESLLTGESTLVVKDAQWSVAGDAPLAERRNMAFAGTMTVHGRGRGVVAATGAATAVGEIAADVLGAGDGKPPLIERMEAFSRWIGAAVLLASLAVAAIGILVYGHPIGAMVLFGIALVVSAIPEGLPIALTVALAVATRRMAQRRVIVRRLAAVEGLGSCTLIASDKTGTLTVNELTVKRIMLPDGTTYDVAGEGFSPEGEVRRGGAPLCDADRERLAELARAAVLCNEADLKRRNGGWLWRGDPTDVALLALAHKLGVTRATALAGHTQLAAIAFEPELRYAASYHRAGRETCVFVKGAPERIAQFCAEAPAAAELLADAEVLARQGFRVLALASAVLQADLEQGAVAPEPRAVVPLGLLGMIDPLRPGVREAVATASAAGVTTIMVTGDHPATALAIARDLGLANEPTQVVSGTEVARLAPDKLGELLRDVRVFARVTPRQKLELVRAAQAAGHFVAVTGDGVNDAPALRAANIGVAMGKSGTDVAREAAELVITDDHYATITAGIEEGRIAYDNIRKIIYLLVSTGAAEVLLVGLAVAAGLPLPLLPAQLLWLNLVTNGIQDVSLGFERGEPGVLERPPRPPREPIFDRLMIERSIAAALVMGGVGFVAFRWMLDNGYDEAAARNNLLLLMVLFENIHLFNCRSERLSVFQLSLRGSGVLVGGVLAASSIHVAMLYLPIGRALLETGPVTLSTWLALAAAATTILFVMELHKLYWRHFVIRTSPNGEEPTAA
jgi:magnesium-transporting ATPase (P-type)